MYEIVNYNKLPLFIHVNHLSSKGLAIPSHILSGDIVECDVDSILGNGELAKEFRYLRCDLAVVL